MTAAPINLPDPAAIAEAILSAPGWARVGISAPREDLREDAAMELARVIVAEEVVGDGEAAGEDQYRLAL